MAMHRIVQWAGKLLAAIGALILVSCELEQSRPIVTLVAEPPTVTSSGSATLRWNSDRAKACVASGAWSGSRPPSGAESVGPITSPQNFSLTCTNRGGAETKSVTVNVEAASIPAVPTVSLNANPANIPSGAAATLTWTSTDATSCVASGAWSGVKPTAGSATTGPLTASSTFSLSCSGAGGTASRSVSVNVQAAPPPPPAPTVVLSADPTNVVSGGATTLTWSSTNAEACTASGAWSGQKPTAGSQSTGPLTARSAYSLSCTGAGGTATQTVTVNVSVPPVPAPTLAFAANPATVQSGSAATLNWTATNASTCSASGAWSGTKPTVGSESTGALGADASYSLTCTGAGGAVSKSLTVIVSTPASPTVSLTASPTTVTSGGNATLTWSASNSNSCTATADPSNGNWVGAKPVSGSAATGPLTAASNTFSITCTGVGGSASKSVIVTVGAASAQTGLDFPGNAGVTNTMRFRFLNPLSIYPATYIWRAYPRRQAGYYTTFFWGNDDGQNNLNTFLWLPGGGADSYYGAHPYPNPAPSGTNHDWEIAVEQNDFVNGRVVYDRWYTQALVVWADANGNKHHEFYWDLPNTDAAHRVVRVSDPSWGNRRPPVPALTWGDAPWAPGQEVFNGVLRGIQIYSTNLSIADILAEANSPLSTSAGSASIWYLNLNPRPDDISDKSGRGHHPAWVGNERPRLWTGP